jgi:hypothetical protein
MAASNAAREEKGRPAAARSAIQGDFSKTPDKYAVKADAESALSWGRGSFLPASAGCVICSPAGLLWKQHETEKI